MDAGHNDGRFSGPDEDRELLEQILSGRLDLFHELVRRHEAAIFRGALAIVGNAADAEDVTQETFLRAFRKLKQFRGEAKLRTWLIQIAVNIARSRRRKLRNERWEPLEADSPAFATRSIREPNPEEACSWKEMGQMVNAVLDGLQPHYRSVLMLREVENLSTAATAMALGTTEETVRTRLRRAREHLRLRMQQMLGESNEK